MRKGSLVCLQHIPIHESITPPKSKLDSPISLHAQDANTRATLITIQEMFTTHMEVLHKELAFSKKLMNKYSHLSTHDGLIDLVVKIDFQFQSLEVVCNN